MWIPHITKCCMSSSLLPLSGFSEPSSELLHWLSFSPRPDDEYNDAADRMSNPTLTILILTGCLLSSSCSLSSATSSSAAATKQGWAWILFFIAISFLFSPRSSGPSFPHPVLIQWSPLILSPFSFHSPTLSFSSSLCHWHRRWVRERETAEQTFACEWTRSV